MKRRTFVRNAGAFSAAVVFRPNIVFGTKANTAIRMGIIGCGSRGTAVISAMSKNTPIAIVAMADIFEDKLQTGLVKYNQLNADKGLPAISPTRIYQGSMAYLKLLEQKEVDAVLISSPCYTHPEFLSAAIAAGKHVYCEKPAAPDVAGCQKLALVAQTIKGRLSVAIGFEIRQASPYVEMIRRVHRGDIGDLISADLYYFSSAVPLQPHKDISDDEARIRNHFHFLELSGGILVDQGIHMLDIANWVLKDHPVEAVGSGSLRSGSDFGNAWNNYQVILSYPGNLKASIHSTQIGPAFGDVCARFIGSRGIAEAHYNRGVFISGDQPWDSGVVKGEATPEQVASGAFLSSLHDADANKVKSFVSSIETGQYLNEIAQGTTSTLTAILGRNAAEQKRSITWDEMIASDQRLDPRLNLTQFDKK